jgi:hypothetical protein
MKRTATNRANCKTAIMKCWRHSSETFGSKLLVLDDPIRWGLKKVRLFVRFVSQPASETIPEAPRFSTRLALAAPLHAPPWGSTPSAGFLPHSSSRVRKDWTRRDGRNTRRPLCRRILERLVQPILSNSVDPGPAPTVFRPLCRPIFPNPFLLGWSLAARQAPTWDRPRVAGPDRLRPQQAEGAGPLPLAAPGAPLVPCQIPLDTCSVPPPPDLTSAERGTAAPVPELMMTAARGGLGGVFFRQPLATR